MIRSLLIARNEKGAAAVEFALAIPVLVMIMWGIFQIAIVLQARAGIEQALGQGARYATIYDTTTNKRPTNSQISAKIVAAKFGLRNGTWHTPVIDTSNESASGYITISVQYDLPTDFLLISGPTIALTESKRVYIQS